MCATNLTYLLLGCLASVLATDMNTNKLVVGILAVVGWMRQGKHPRLPARRCDIRGG